MANKTLFAATEKMLYQAKSYIERNDISSIELLLSSNEDIIEDALKAISRGTEIIIARGNYASLVRKNSKIPVVDIVVTVQEMGILIDEAKKIINKNRPKIGVVGTSNLYCDMRYFNDIFGISLKEYLVDDISDLKAATEHALSDKVDIIFGGRKVGEYVAGSEIPYLFIDSTADSIQQAFQTTASVEYAIELEKKNSAEFKTLLDYSFSSIIKFDSAGEVVTLNHIAEKIFRVKAADVISKSIYELIGEFDKQQFHDVLKNGREVFASITYIHDKAIVYNLVPITIGDRIDGAIMQGFEIDKLNKLEADTRKRHHSLKGTPKFNFKWMEQNIGFDKETYKLAARFAQADAPILILGGTGFEAEIFAQSIHNASFRKNNPFISAECAAFQDEDQLSYLFGTATSKYHGGIVPDAHNGTLFINEIETLSIPAQYRVMKLITDKVSIQEGDHRLLPVDTKLIVRSRKNLWDLVAAGLFREDLYQALSSLMITLAPLYERKEEVAKWVDHYITHYSNSHSRYISITKGARKLLIEYPWQSNVPQLRNFCEKLVISSPRRSVDEIIVSQLLEEAYPSLNKTPSGTIIVYKEPEAALINELLIKHNGNRKNVANEMNISTTTLWRKIKKHRIVWGGHVPDEQDPLPNL